MEAAAWTDKRVALELWSHLTYLSYDAQDHAVVAKCAAKTFDIDKLLGAKKTADKCVLFKNFNILL